MQEFSSLFLEFESYPNNRYMSFEVLKLAHQGVSELPNRDQTKANDKQVFAS